MFAVVLPSVANMLKFNLTESGRRKREGERKGRERCKSGKLQETGYREGRGVVIHHKCQGPRCLDMVASASAGSESPRCRAVAARLVAAGSSRGGCGG